MSSSYIWTVSESANMDDAEETLIVSAIAAEGLYGRARVRIDGDFTVDHAQRACTVNADTKVGRSIAQIFTELLILEIGEDKFKVNRACRCAGAKQQPFEKELG